MKQEILNRIIKNIEEYIKINVYKKLEVIKIIEMNIIQGDFYFNEDKIRKEFKFVTGMSIRQWINKEKMEKIEELFLENTCILRVARMMGFKDESGLNKFTRRMKGKSAKQYQQEIIKSNEKNKKIQIPEVKPVDAVHAVWY